MHMCTCMHANLLFFAPVGAVVGIDVVGLESVDGGAHIILHWWNHYSVCFRIEYNMIQVCEVYEHTWKFYY